MAAFGKTSEFSWLLHRETYPVTWEDGQDHETELNIGMG